MDTAPPPPSPLNYATPSAIRPERITVDILVLLLSVPSVALGIYFWFHVLSERWRGYHELDVKTSLLVRMAWHCFGMTWIAPPWIVVALVIAIGSIRPIGLRRKWYRWGIGLWLLTLVFFEACIVVLETSGGVTERWVSTYYGPPVPQAWRTTSEGDNWPYAQFDRGGDLRSLDHRPGDARSAAAMEGECIDL